MKDLKDKIRKLLIEHDSKTTGGFASDCWDAEGVCDYPEKINQLIDSAITRIVGEERKRIIEMVRQIKSIDDNGVVDFVNSIIIKNIEKLYE